MSNSTKIINNILLVILVFFMVFDTARNYTHMPKFLGDIKDIIIYLWLVELLCIKKIKVPFQNISFYLIFLLAFFWSWIGILYPVDEALNVNNINPIIFILKQNEFFILLFVFANYELLFSKKYDRYINLYIYLSIILFFITLIGVYIDNPFISKTIVSENNMNMPDYANRISLGQPAIASFPQLITLFFLLLCKKKNVKTIIGSSICFLGVLLSTSITGIMTSFALLLLLIVYYLITANYQTKLKLIVGISIVILSYLYFLQTDFFYDNLSVAYLFVDNRIDQFLYGTSVDPSMEARVVQTEYVLKMIHMSVAGFLLGQGCNGVIIENTYYGLFLRFGIIGIIGYILFFLSLLKTAIVKRSMFMMVFLGVYVANFYTLDVLYSPTLSYTFSFFLFYYLNYVSNSKMVK